MAGQLINRGERTWLVRVFLGRDVLTGKKKYHNKTVKGNKKDAQRYLNGVLREIDLGKFSEPKKVSLNKFLEKWLKDAVKPRVRERTYHSYEQILRCYVSEGLGPRLNAPKLIRLKARHRGLSPFQNENEPQLFKLFLRKKRKGRLTHSCSKKAIDSWLVFQKILFFTVWRLRK